MIVVAVYVAAIVAAQFAAKVAGGALWSLVLRRCA